MRRLTVTAELGVRSRNEPVAVPTASQLSHMPSVRICTAGRIGRARLDHVRGLAYAMGFAICGCHRSERHAERAGQRRYPGGSPDGQPTPDALRQEEEDKSGDEEPADACEGIRVDTPQQDVGSEETSAQGSLSGDQEDGTDAPARMRPAASPVNDGPARPPISRAARISSSRPERHRAAGVKLNSVMVAKCWRLRAVSVSGLLDGSFPAALTTSTQILEYK